MIAGFVTDDALRLKYRVSREEYLSVPSQIRRKYREYLANNRSPVLNLKQFQQKAIAKPKPVVPARRIVRFG